MTYDVSGLIKSTSRAIPQIYAYTTPEIAAHDGWTKIGYTEQDVDTRIKQQTHTADISWHKEWQGNAIYEDGTGDTFTDHDFHAYLRKLGYKDKPGTEWFCVSGKESHGRFIDFRIKRGEIPLPEAVPYQLRAEQKQAVAEALDYSRLHERAEFLWNAKPRFGKTLTAYDLCKQMDAKTVLIVTNRPAIANSWYEDYVRFLGEQSGYCFISEATSLAKKPHVMTQQEFMAMRRNDRNSCNKFIAFVSLQDLKGSLYFGGDYDKYKWLTEIHGGWDVLIIDEAHEGVDTYLTDVAFDHIDRKFTLHLSGTPFKALANDKFPQNAIYNWTYADEQKAKEAWPDDAELPNPYANLPRLNMFTYKMSDIMEEKVAVGADIDGKSVEYAFDLNEFFATTAAGNFIHNDDVDRFLEALTAQLKFPFSTPELRSELKHTLWMLNFVDSARALAKKLRKHPVFGEYEIVLAAGDGKIDNDDERAKSFDKVRSAIATHEKTITLSVGQLTTGVTIPEWTAVLMLSNMKSPALYMQAAFRAQNPCLFYDNGKYLRKENAYVFDFDPARTLTIFEQFANDLYSDTSGARGDLDTRKAHIKELLNFFPVIGEDEDGQMVELDAAQVLSVPRKIRSTEVVRRGFMSDFLFQNISNVFRAPAAVVELIQNFEPCKAPNNNLDITPETADELSLDENGDVNIPQEVAIGLASDLFGDKVYGKVEQELQGSIEYWVIKMEDERSTDEDELIRGLSKAFVHDVTEPLVEAAKQSYRSELKSAQQKRIERKIKADADMTLNREVGDYKIQRSIIEKSRTDALAEAETDEAMDAINAEHDERMREVADRLRRRLEASRPVLVESAGATIVREVETAKKEAAKRDIETGIRDHLRGFSRTIPSFLMAYGDKGTTLANFDIIIPPDVFKGVTSITVDEFRFLRDGGPYEEDGEIKHFDGNLFDPVVFDDSVQEFIALRTRLADYFDEGQTEDIFDYVPPQKTNQIYTPKRVVKQMVDLFEQENPGCFDDPTHTFADLYMKSGLYITEIVTRLYNSERMRELFPDDDERLKHILSKQVFGIAPTEIIYQIATHFILGYDGEHGQWLDSNFVCADSAALAKEGKLAEFVEKTFGGKM
ncbi:DEAD/DEAH box helicase family protein [Adlercreutzia sp. ZJ473]|uniref:DEAD/DEAH box helicase family protein n=1 Tax=Adlercreutzia sp. ZJ473 TaxID=2722822 RepID=UPI001552C025|nr:DEAD/DEAH box helicase family protein [Adlercreutzia sp. ZJ473]